MEIAQGSSVTLTRELSKIEASLRELDLSNPMLMVSELDSEPLRASGLRMPVTTKADSMLSASSALRSKPSKLQQSPISGRSSFMMMQSTSERQNIEAGAKKKMNEEL